MSVPPASLPRYDPSQTYRWNYDHAPQSLPQIAVPQVPGTWTVCGRAVPSPLGIAAGPLLNGRWILYYAALGFDLLTYKTTRSSSRECYPLPNLLPVESGPLADAGRELLPSATMHGSWAVSFGMPSMTPDVWRADVEWTRSRLPRKKLLSVSVVATPQPDWSLDDLAADFAQCARWAVESGADCVETNFSCPNVSTTDGQLYQQPAAAGLVAAQVRQAIGKTPYIIKVGLVSEAASIAHLLDAVAPHADALAMTNCISATVRNPSGRQVVGTLRVPSGASGSSVATDGTRSVPATLTGDLLFDGQPRGIGGEAIRAASIEQVRRFADIARQRGHATRMIGVGGISIAQHVREYLSAGAEAVQLATSAMVDPLVGVKICREW